MHWPSGGSEYYSFSVLILFFSFPVFCLALQFPGGKGGRIHLFSLPSFFLFFLLSPQTSGAHLQNEKKMGMLLGLEGEMHKAEIKWMGGPMRAVWVGGSGWLWGSAQHPGSLQLAKPWLWFSHTGCTPGLGRGHWKGTVVGSVVRPCGVTCPWWRLCGRSPPPPPAPTRKLVTAPGGSVRPRSRWH